MNQKQCVSYRFYLAWDYEEEEKMLNQKSRQGWHLIKGGCLRSVFTYDSNISYHYRIDFNLDISRNNEAYLRYVDMNKELGWEVVNITFNGWIYLRKERKNEEDVFVEFYTDSQSFNAMINRWIHFIYLVIAILLLTLFPLIHQIHIWNKYALILFAYILVLLGLMKGIRKMKRKLR